MEKKMLIPWEQSHIPCKLYLPDVGGVDQVILGIHGFGGDKDSQALQAVAEEMYFYRTATITIDLPGHGENPVPVRDLNLRGCRSCLRTVAEFLRQEFPDVSHYGIYAVGFGGYIALLAMDELQEILGSVRVVLQAPAVRMNKTFLRLARTDEASLLKKGRVVCDGLRRMELPYSFYEDLVKNNCVADYEMPMLILRAERDELVEEEDLEFFRLLNGKSCLVTAPGAGHRFERQQDLDIIADLSRDWFLCEEVLLCEYV